jgi:hypothetical protein
LNAGQEFGEGERLGQVVIPPRLQALDAIIDGSFALRMMTGVLIVLRRISSMSLTLQVRQHISIMQAS